MNSTIKTIKEAADAANIVTVNGIKASEWISPEGNASVFRCGEHSLCEGRSLIYEGDSAAEIDDRFAVCRLGTETHFIDFDNRYEPTEFTEYTDTDGKIMVECKEVSAEAYIMEDIRKERADEFAGIADMCRKLVEDTVPDNADSFSCTTDDGKLVVYYKNMKENYLVEYDDENDRHILCMNGHVFIEWDDEKLETNVIRFDAHEYCIYEDGVGFESIAEVTVFDENDLTEYTSTETIYSYDGPESSTDYKHIWVNNNEYVIEIPEEDDSVYYLAE
ncbi:MAG: hypothetical protein J1F11_04940 [Oscillospiraceae bacterium]|nr:hypothetical protein [Oscillospiraceae bacterium]